MIKDEFYDKQYLRELGIKDPDAANLYIFCLGNDINTNLIRIESDDINIIWNKKLVTKEILEDSAKYTIHTERPAVVEIKSKDSEIDSFIKEYRNLFKGLKNEAIGIKALVKTNLLEFLKNNSQYTLEDIMRATKLYIKSFEAKDRTYMRQADYFIYKKLNNGPKVSTLLEVLENESDYKKRSSTWSQII